MRARRSQFDVPEPFTPYLGECDLDAALVTDHAAMLHALVFAAQALPVRNRTENAGAEQAIPLRLEGAVIDGLRLGHLAMRPAADLFRRGQADSDGIEIGNRVAQIKWT